MNRYPLWKYLSILTVIAIGLLYALPNFFSQFPAIQVSSSREAHKIDASTLETIESTLKQNQLPYRGASLQSEAILAVFNDDESQQKARGLIQNKLGDDYIVAFNLHSSSPLWLSNMGALPMYLGLDLRGGVHFLLQVDMKAAINKAMDRYTADLRTQMREKKIGYSGVSREGQSVSVRVHDASEADRATNEIKNNFPELQLNRTTVNNEYKLTAALGPEGITRIQKNAVEQNLKVLRRRIDELGVAEPIIQQQGADRIVVQLPGVQDTARAKDLIGRTPALEVRMVNEEGGALEAALKGNVPYGNDLLSERTGQPVLVNRQVVITGERINDAQAGFDSQGAEPIVSVSLDNQGGRIFREVTRNNIGKRMAVVLIEKGKTEVITAPVIRDELGSRFQISGRMSTREANDISLLMRAGALAAPMEIVEERTVGPSLGKDNIEKGFHSVMYGFAILSLFICAYYLFMGFISTIALVVNLLLLVALLSMLQATLTLPGIAAIALTLGMAIDANVLINERIREEMRNGAAPQTALSAGYERAWGTILDSNITTLIAGIALFIFGSGPVRGFAVVHCLGILTSMFSAVLVSRSLVNLMYGRVRKLEKISIGQIWRPTK